MKTCTMKKGTVKAGETVWFNVLSEDEATIKAVSVEAMEAPNPHCSCTKLVAQVTLSSNKTVQIDLFDREFVDYRALHSDTYSGPYKTKEKAQKDAQRYVQYCSTKFQDGIDQYQGWLEKMQKTKIK